MPNVDHERHCQPGLPDPAGTTAEHQLTWEGRTFLVEGRVSDAKPVPKKEMHADRCKDEPVDQVGWILDTLDTRGSFLRCHLARMCYAWTTLALVQESTPYMFASLRDDFALSVEDLGVFAASFQLGCVAGAVLSVASLDTYGRHCSAVVALAVCAVCSTLSAFTWTSFTTVVALRVLQSCAWWVSFCLNSSTLSCTHRKFTGELFLTHLSCLRPSLHVGLWHRRQWQRGTPSSFLLRVVAHSWRRTRSVGRSVGSLLLRCLAQASHGEPCICSWPSLLECSDYYCTEKQRRRDILPSVGAMRKRVKFSSVYLLSMGKFYKHLLVSVY